MMSIRNLLLVVILFLSLSTLSKAYEVGVGQVDFSNLHYNQSDLWGADVLVAASEPEGPISGVKATSGIIWIAINDTTISSGKGILFYRSTNSGVNWVLHPNAITPAMIVDQIKMLRAGDSTYCFFRQGTTMYRYNVANNSFATLPQTAVTQFDIVASSTNSLYIYYSNATQVLRTGSTDGGFTWINNGTVTSNVAPTLGISATGDTLDVMYRATGGNTTAVTRFRYRETAPGTVTPVSTATIVLAAGTTRTIYRSYRYGAVEWIVYTEGDAPGTQVKCMVSTDGGNTYGKSINVSSLGTDNPWFTAGISTGGGFLGIDLFFVKDSAVVANDKVMYTYAAIGSPNFSAGRIPISEFIPLVSTRNYVPSAMELGNADVGIAYVGINGGNRNVYWDKFSNVSGIHQNSGIVESYDLKQNYPNPFNPSTTISFSLPKSDFVSLKVFDVTGKEVQTILNKKLEQGSYDVNFDASHLTSGVYFYTLVSSDFTSTKKMMLIK